MRPQEWIFTSSYQITLSLWKQTIFWNKAKIIWLYILIINNKPGPSTIHILNCTNCETQWLFSLLATLNGIQIREAIKSSTVIQLEINSLQLAASKYDWKWSAFDRSIHQRQSDRTIRNAVSHAVKAHRCIIIHQLLAASACIFYRWLAVPQVIFLQLLRTPQAHTAI